MGLVVTPIKKDQLEAWKTWAQSLKSENRRDFEDFNRRYGLTRHDAWLAETPAGPMAVVLHEGPGADSVMQKVAGSDNSFDVAFKEKLKQFHGMDLNGPPPGPMPVKVI